MTDADAARRRELQRRAFGPGGHLTAEETEELRMLSQPAPGLEPAPEPTRVSESAPASESTPVAGLSPAPAPRLNPGSGPSSVSGSSPLAGASFTSDPSVASTPSPAPGPAAGRPAIAEPGAAAEPPATAGSSPAPDSAPAAEPSPATGPGAAPRTRRFRVLLAVVAAAAVLVGFGASWLAAPRASGAAPVKMNAAQQKAQKTIAESGDVDADSLTFLGEKYDTWAWRATHGDEQCLVLADAESRAVSCADPEKGSYGSGFIATGLSRDEGDQTISVNGSLVRTVTGEWTVVLDEWAMTRDDDEWQQQYSPDQLRLVEAMQDAGFEGSQVQLIALDGTLPVWASFTDRKCAMVVDPDSLEVAQSCEPADSSEPVEVRFRDAVYSVRWPEQRMPVATIIRSAKDKAPTTCDPDAAQCTQIDDKTGETGE